MTNLRFYLLVVIATIITFLDPSIADFQQQDTDNVYQREHSLVKPYQGAGMVSNTSTPS